MSIKTIDDAHLKRIANSIRAIKKQIIQWKFLKWQMKLKILALCFIHNKR